MNDTDKNVYKQRGHEERERYDKEVLEETAANGGVKFITST